jgi:phosphopantetheine adenylyltransferase
MLNSCALSHAGISRSTHCRLAVIQGYIWRTVQRQGACVFFRGIRSWEKDGVEERKLQILNTWGPLLYGPLWWPMPTVFLQGDPQYAHISSTLIRDVCRSPNGATSGKLDHQSTLESLVPPSIAKTVGQLYGGDKR